MLRIETRESQVERDLAGARSAYAQTLELLKELINVSTEVSLDISGVLTPAPNKIVHLRYFALLSPLNDP